MSGRIRKRMSGDRRRGSLQNLVRTRTGIAVIPPAPLLGNITRIMRPELIDDYADLSTATWSTGSSGIPAGNHYFYFHYVTPDARTISKDFVLAPVRWRIAVPEEDGQYYDHVRKRNLSSFVDYDDPSTFNSTIGRGISPNLLPVGSHAVFANNLAYLTARPMFSPAGHLTSTTPTSFSDPGLQAIAPTVPVWNAFRSQSRGGVDDRNDIAIHAIRHWVNDSPVDDVRMNPPWSSPNDDAWKVPLRSGDRYFVDLWYRVISSAFAPLNQSGPAKACVVIPRRRISNDSEQPNTARISLSNVDFSPNYNQFRHRYSVTVDGHTGWTLKDGSNGPHLMKTGDGWTFTHGTGQMVWTKNVNDSFVRAIILRYGQEVAHIELWTGPLMSTGASRVIGIYRSDDDNEFYRKQTQSRDYGTVHHANPGMFNQAGATTFQLVPWSTSQEVVGNPTPGVSNLAVPAASLLPTGPVYPQLPTSITVRRR